MHTEATKGSDVKVGDTLHVMGRASRVAEVKPYENAFTKKTWPEGGVRIAMLDTGLCLTLEPTATYYISA